MINSIFDDIDVDGKGSINYNQFILATINEREFLTDGRIKAIFEQFKKDGSGAITIDEIKETFGFRSEDKEDLEKLFAQLDEKKENALQYGDFKKMLVAMTC